MPVLPKYSNRLLRKLPEPEYQRFVSRLELVSLTLKQLIYQENAPIKHVYFPLNTLVSHVATMQDGTVIEVSTSGNEGMIGLPALLRSERSKFPAFALISGQALRMSVEDFRTEVKRSPALDYILHRYAEVLLIEIAQGRACNQLHSIHQRCARWLLKMHDSVDHDEFEITQEFLCQLLGVRRASISEVASALQKSDLIRYTRGKMSILDRQGLEAAGCECYRVIRSEYERQSPIKNALNGNHR